MKRECICSVVGHTPNCTRSLTGGAVARPGLTDDEARDYAKRWAGVHMYERAIQEWRDGDRGDRPEPPPFWALDASERERLFSWVRQWLESYVTNVTNHLRSVLNDEQLAEYLTTPIEKRDLGSIAHQLAFDLGWSNDYATAIALLDAAGWKG